jgi:glucose-1-phosphate thymidylyltransferase
MVMAFCDTLIETDLDFLKSEDADGVAWVKPMEDPRRFGVAELDKAGLATRMIEKPKDCANNLVLVGFYFFKDARELISAIREQIKRNTALKGEYFLADAINIMLERGMRLKVKQTDVWLDAGIPSAVLETNKILLDKGRGQNTNFPGETVTVIQPVSIAEGCKIKSSVIGPHVTIGKDCVIENVILRNSIIEAGTSIQNMVIEDSLIGKKVNLKGRAEQFNIGDDTGLTR